MTNDDIIKKWLAGELSDEEKREFESAEKFADVRKLSDALYAFKLLSIIPKKNIRNYPEGYSGKATPLPYITG